MQMCTKSSLQIIIILCEGGGQSSSYRFIDIKPLYYDAKKKKLLKLNSYCSGWMYAIGKLYDLLSNSILNLFPKNCMYAYKRNPKKRSFLSGLTTKRGGGLGPDH